MNRNKKNIVQTFQIEKREMGEQIKDWIKGINHQQLRIKLSVGKTKAEFERREYSMGRKKWTSHDADFYFILAKRAHRFIKYLAQVDSKVANLKGCNEDLLSKLEIRNITEHWGGWEKFPSLSQNSMIKVSMGFKLNKDDIILYSGNFEWDFIEDHKKFIKILEDILILMEQNKNEMFLFKKN